MDSAEVLKEYGKYANIELPEGSIASDLSRFDDRRTVREAVQASDKAAGSKVRQIPVKRQKISFGALLMCLLIAGLAALLISNYVSLTVMTDELSKLSGQLDTLKNEEVILQKQYDERYILNDIETYAVNTLGMVKLESSMTEYIELSAPDTIVMIDPYENAKVSGLFDDLRRGMQTVLEFLT